MDIKDAIKARHSVRFYKDEPISDEHKAELEALIGECNAESGLHLQLIVDDKAMADLEVRGGYYGQKIVLAAQMMGLNTCWVAGTYKRGKCKAEVKDNEKIVCVIAIGYGENQGTKHKSKPLSKLCSVPESKMPVWFKNGVKAAMMAPTAMNQQKFRISLEEDEPIITSGRGPMTGLDLGIVKYNFEAASGRKV